MDRFSRNSWQVQAYRSSLLETSNENMSTITHEKNGAGVRVSQLPRERSTTPGRGGAASVRSEDAPTAVLGSTELYENGKIRCIPMPTPDPKDPLNLSNRRKWTAIVVLCLFGSLGLAAEVVIGALLPVFLLQYSGIEPSTVLSDPKLAAQAVGVDPFSVLPAGVTPMVSLMQVSLLATVPQVANGVASYLLIPLSTAIGRRPVLLLTGIAAWAGGFWAGSSQSLMSHIAARVVHGLGAGAVEALLPLIVQDMTFIHQRARATAAVIASQGLFIVALGIAGPYLSAHFTWRWVYWITSGLGLVVWFLLIAFVPETRWLRSKEELSGQQVYPLVDGENRPRLDPKTYGERTAWTNVGLFQYGFEWKEAGMSIIDALRTTMFPTMIYIVIINIAFMTVNSATLQSTSFALLGAGIPFEWTGLSVIPSILATFSVYVFGGFLVDKIALRITKMNGGQREPEHLLPNFAVPFISGIAGCFIFGVASQNNLHWSILILGSFLTLSGSLIMLTVSNVYLVESYPQWAGPVLNNASSLKVIATFFVASNVTTWSEQIGPLRLFAIFAELLIVLSLGVPVLYFFGKRLRMWTGGKIKDRTLADEKALSKQETKSETDV